MLVRLPLKSAATGTEGEVAARQVTGKGRTHTAAYTACAATTFSAQTEAMLMGTRTDADTAMTTADIVAYSCSDSKNRMACNPLCRSGRGDGKCAAKTEVEKARRGEVKSTSKK